MSRVIRKPPLWFPTRSDTHPAVQAKKIARGWTFWIQKVEKLYYPCSENKKALISFALTAKLICAFVYAFAKCWVSHGATHIFELGQFKSGFPHRSDVVISHPMTYLFSTVSSQNSFKPGVLLMGHGQTV